MGNSMLKISFAAIIFCCSISLFGQDTLNKPEPSEQEKPNKNNQPYKKTTRLLVGLGYSFGQKVKFENISLSHPALDTSLLLDGEPTKYKNGLIVSFDYEKDISPGFFWGVGVVTTSQTESKEADSNTKGNYDTTNPAGLFGKIGINNTTDGGIVFKLFGGIGMGNISHKSKYVELGIRGASETNRGICYQIGFNIDVKNFAIELNHLGMKGDLKGFVDITDQNNLTERFDVAGELKLQMTALSLVYTF